MSDEHLTQRRDASDPFRVASVLHLCVCVHSSHFPHNPHGEAMPNLLAALGWLSTPSRGRLESMADPDWEGGRPRFFFRA